MHKFQAPANDGVEFRIVGRISWFYLIIWYKFLSKYVPCGLCFQLCGSVGSPCGLPRIGNNLVITAAECFPRLRLFNNRFPAGRSPHASTTILRYCMLSRLRDNTYDFTAQDLGHKSTCAGRDSRCSPNFRGYSSVCIPVVLRCLADNFEAVIFVLMTALPILERFPIKY